MPSENLSKLKEEDSLAFIKLEGEGLSEGIVGAKSGSDILSGIDRMMRRGLVQKYPSLNDIEFDIPVLIQKGSWTALIPNDLVSWVVTAAGASLTAYGVKAGQNMADTDFTDKGIRDVVKKSVGALQSTIKIAKHLKGPRKKVKEGIRFEDNNQTLLIPNDKGEYLKVKREEYDTYMAYPEELLADIAGSPSLNQHLSVGLVDNGKIKVESIRPEDARYFAVDSKLEGDGKVLFPEMKHGDKVEIVGILTRGNSQSNSMGFKYQDHILTCTPLKGKVEQYKPQLFQKCILRGRVLRLVDGSFKDTNLRPRLVIYELDIIEGSNQQVKLV